MRHATRAVLRKAGLTLLIGVLSAALAAELTLRLGGTYSTYSERNYGEYRPVLGRSLPTWIHGWTPGQVHHLPSTEFDFEYAINADGVRDLEHELAKPEGVRRIVIFGDSFVEGVGAQREQSWPAQLEGLLGSSGAAVEVFNAGVSGSDPCFEVQLLKQRFLRYEPDLVIVSLNASDQVDVLAWGGMERFQADGTTRGRPQPRFEPLYVHSHLVRWALHVLWGYDRELNVFGSPGRARLDAQHLLIEACERFAELGRQHDFELLVLVHPLPDMLSKAETLYFRMFYDELAARGIEAHDLTTPLQ